MFYHIPSSIMQFIHAERCPVYMHIPSSIMQFIHAERCPVYMMFYHIPSSIMQFIHAERCPVYMEEYVQIFVMMSTFLLLEIKIKNILKHTFII